MKSQDIYVRHPLERSRFLTPVKGKSLTQQSFKDESDINVIVGRFQQSGQLPPNFKQPSYEDVSGLAAPFSEIVVTAEATRITAEAWFAEHQQNLPLGELKEEVAPATPPAVPPAQPPSTTQPA